MNKQELRLQIRRLKRQYTSGQIDAKSEVIIGKLEVHPDFRKAQTVMIYSALPDEVRTAGFIQRWRNRKRLILPTVVGDDIIPVELTAGTGFAVGDFHILEPQNEPYSGDFDLIVVPGVAFDREGNRIGRGRGYYDRFLCQYPETPKIGICFDFQMVEHVPTEPNDIRMNEVICD